MTYKLRKSIMDLYMLVSYIIRVMYKHRTLFKLLMIFAVAFAAAWLIISRIFLSVAWEEAGEDIAEIRPIQPSRVERFERKVALWSLSVSYRIFRNIYEWCREVLEDDENEISKYDDKGVL